MIVHHAVPTVLQAGLFPIKHVTADSMAIKLCSCCLPLVLHPQDIRQQHHKAADNQAVCHNLVSALMAQGGAAAHSHDFCGQIQ